ncbi:2Fe-2S iron-sulfur cluster-binding protein [Candidatus Entotheonella palauensis]|uniref:2Fe-2S iron-sulfur cluster-binding protein n=1 Tax=Candidatus Entotheonella palauensis TaxID=93172 RepID=UPI002118F45D|nr:2Fe-2S iron-sulfur cluster-binding protein [Candidatus Entotheonella palauensis]
MAFDLDTKQFTVTILDSGESFRCHTSQTVLSAMIAMGRRGIPSGCHGGGCGVCKILIRKGTVDTLPLSRAHVTEADEQRGYSLACRTYPLSDIEVEVKGQDRHRLSRRPRYGFV